MSSKAAYELTDSVAGGVSSSPAPESLSSDVQSSRSILNSKGKAKARHCQLPSDKELPHRTPSIPSETGPQAPTHQQPRPCRCSRYGLPRQRTDNGASSCSSGTSPSVGTLSAPTRPSRRPSPYPPRKISQTAALGLGFSPSDDSLGDSSDDHGPAKHSAASKALRTRRSEPIAKLDKREAARKTASAAAAAAAAAVTYPGPVLLPPHEQIETRNAQGLTHGEFMGYFEGYAIDGNGRQMNHCFGRDGEFYYYEPSPFLEQYVEFPPFQEERRGWFAWLRRWLWK